MGRGAHAHRAARAGRAVGDLGAPGTFTDDGGEQLARRRHEDDAERRTAISDQADVDGEIIAALYELAGAVERIDQEEAAVEFRHTAFRHALLANHRDRRGSCGHALGDQHFRGAVGIGDRRLIGFLLDRQTGAPGGHDDVAGGDGSGDHVAQQSGVVDLTHGCRLIAGHPKRKARAMAGLRVFRPWAILGRHQPTGIGEFEVEALGHRLVRDLAGVDVEAIT